MKKKKPWRIDDKYLDRLELDEVKFIFEHAEKQLIDTLDTNKIMGEKLATLLSFTTGLMIALIGFCIQRWSNSPVMDHLLRTSVYGSGYLFVLSLFLIYNIKPKSYCILGAQPSCFFNDQVFQEKHSEKDRQVIMYVNEIESYQARILENKTYNKTRWTLYKIALYLLVTAPILFAFYFLFIT